MFLGFGRFSTRGVTGVKKKDCLQNNKNKSIGDKKTKNNMAFFPPPPAPSRLFLLDFSIAFLSVS
jgi:hypothetical protein